MLNFIKKHFHYLFLLGFSLLVLFVNMRINLFSYNNFDMGKFDLGNMTQMLWNTLNGRTLYLTDYFGTNLPRWAMSHVDPILLLFVPVFALAQHPLTLVFSQLVLLIFASVIIYKIALLELNHKFSALLISLSYLFYPALGFLTARTGFHGVSAAVPFFLAAFYVFEVMHKDQKFTKARLILFWLLLIITMSGKEQIPLYIFAYGVFILLFRNPVLTENNLVLFTKERFRSVIKHTAFKLAIWMMIVSSVWFYTAFFVIIPKYAHYRIDGYNKFAESLNINTGITRDVALPNYFLSRYDLFGDSYSDVLFNVIINPKQVVKVIFGGDKIENLNQTFAPLSYIPFLAPQVLVISLPDFLINYLTTAGGIGTAEIRNHRISMIVPVLFLAVIYGISTINSLFLSRLKLSSKAKFVVYTLLPAILLISNIHTSFKYENPVYLWLSQSVSKHLPSLIAYAKTDGGEFSNKELKVGEIVKVSELENKDRECALKIVNMIPANASVSGPDYLGAHLSMRETYAIFPALYNDADYVIVDVFSKKILDILDVDINLIKDVVEHLIKSKDYSLVVGCGNLFVFERSPDEQKDSLLPVQMRFEYNEKFNYEIYASLSVVDFNLPQQFDIGDVEDVRFVYTKKSNDSLDGYVMFMSFINTTTGEIYQAANLPSFGILQPEDWDEDVYYIEDVQVALPKYLDTGEYKVFIGMSNKIKNRSIYLGDVEVK